MADLSALVGAAGALVGVGLGAWLTARAQRSLLREYHRQAHIDAQKLAYSEFLSTHRQFRRYIMTEPVKVRLIERAPGVPPTPVIDNVARYWESIENATAKMEIVGADGIPYDVWHAVRASFYDIARARANYELGEVPEEIVEAARAAEREFVRAVREDLLASEAD
jgi:hypothetical protein